MRLTIYCSGYTLTLTRLRGIEQLSVNDSPVSLCSTSSLHSEHRFSVDNKQWSANLNWQPNRKLASYRLTIDGLVVANGESEIEGNPADAEPLPKPEKPPKQSSRNGKGLGWLALGLKLLKSATVIKAALLGASFASYSYLFSWKLALVLIAILVIHEWGHLLAMKRFGIATKGIYLVPFVGGAAVPAEKFKTQWQELYVAMAGPSFGLASTLLAWAAYQLTGSAWLGATVTLGAFLNLFNLLPIHPLDGGRVLKAAVASSRSKSAFYGLLVCSSAGFLLSLYAGLTLLAVLVIFGIWDLLDERKKVSAQLPMDSWGLMVGTAWYLAVFLPLLMLVWGMAESGLPGTHFPKLLLST
ncbi:metalloprotease [Gallaecimonas mangrovi]|uniref:metalloprotease n=1 Tax=Gallaecimonas mangrovi TaxID=2291597 RepID=UPI000E1FF8F0|nr:site-2 protease family protein [Gallaecimonas mangrovi]